MSFFHHDGPVVYVLWKNGMGTRTYVGYTVNLNRRIRQHRGEIKGGAVYTRKQNMNVLFYVEGFQNKREALQFEWALKRAPRRAGYSAFLTDHNLRKWGSGPKRRVIDLLFMWSLERWTKRSPKSSNLNLTVHWTTHEFRDLWAHLLPLAAWTRCSVCYKFLIKREE